MIFIVQKTHIAKIEYKFMESGHCTMDGRFNTQCYRKIKKASYSIIHCSKLNDKKSEKKIKGPYRIIELI